MEDEEPQIRWEKVNTLYEDMVKTIYESEFSGNEIDILINRLWTKINTDKLTTVSYWEIQRMLALDGISKMSLDTKKTDVPGIH